MSNLTVNIRVDPCDLAAAASILEANGVSLRGRGLSFLVRAIVEVFNTSTNAPFPEHSEAMNILDGIKAGGNRTPLALDPTVLKAAIKKAALTL